MNPRLDFFLLVVSQIFLKIKKLERNSKIIDRRLEREEREQIYRKEGKRSLTCRTSVWSKARSGRTFSLSLSLHSLSFSFQIRSFLFSQMTYSWFSLYLMVDHFFFNFLIINFSFSCPVIPDQEIMFEKPQSLTSKNSLRKESPKAREEFVNCIFPSNAVAHKINNSWILEPLSLSTFNFILFHTCLDIY